MRGSPFPGSGGRAAPSPCSSRLGAHPSGGPALRRSLPGISPGAGRRARSTRARARSLVSVPAALRRPPLGSGGCAGGVLFPGVGVGVGPGRGEPMMSAAAAAAGPGRGRALGGPGPEPEPELEAGETGAAGGGHGDEPGLADAAPSQSGGPRGEPGRARADRSQQPGPLPAARRCGGPGRARRRARSPLGLTWGLRGRGLSLAPPPGAHSAGGRLRGPGYGFRPSGGRGGAIAWGRGKGRAHSPLEGLILQPGAPLPPWGRLGVGWGGCEPGPALQAAGRAMA